MCCGRGAAGGESAVIEGAPGKRNRRAFKIAVGKHCDAFKADELKRLADLYNSGT